MNLDWLFLPREEYTLSLIGSCITAGIISIIIYPIDKITQLSYVLAVISVLILVKAYYGELKVQ